MSEVAEFGVVEDCAMPDWIKVVHEVPDKPEVHQVAELLGVSAEDVVGRLIRLWVWADQQGIGEDGRVGVGFSVIDSIVRMPGFAEALVVGGWMQDDGGSLRRGGHGEQNGDIAKRRASAAERQARRRESIAEARDAIQQAAQGEQAPLDGIAPPLPAKEREITFTAWVQQELSRGNKLISTYEPVVRYAKDHNIPTEFLEIAWDEFKYRFGKGGLQSSRRYIDWRKAFWNYVVNNYFQIWRVSPEGEYVLAPKGIEVRERMQRKARQQSSASSAA